MISAGSRPRPRLNSYLFDVVLKMSLEKAERNERGDREPDPFVEIGFVSGNGNDGENTAASQSEYAPETQESMRRESKAVDIKSQFARGGHGEQDAFRQQDLSHRANGTAFTHGHLAEYGTRQNQAEIDGHHGAEFEETASRKFSCRQCSRNFSPKCADSARSLNAKKYKIYCYENSIYNCTACGGQKTHRFQCAADFLT